MSDRDRTICPLNRTKTACERARGAVCGFCRSFHAQGWLNAAGGAISVREGNQIFLGPCDIRLPCPRSTFILDLKNEIIEIKERGYSVCQDRAPFMMAAHAARKAGAVVHSISLQAMMVGWIFDDEVEFAGQPPAGERDELARPPLRIPVLLNARDEKVTQREFLRHLTERPTVEGILIRGDGFYTWGRDLAQAQLRVRFYESLFGALLKERDRKTGTQQVLE